MTNGKRVQLYAESNITTKPLHDSEKRLSFENTKTTPLSTIHQLFRENQRERGRHHHGKETELPVNAIVLRELTAIGDHNRLGGLAGARSDLLDRLNDVQSFNNLAEHHVLSVEPLRL